MSYRSEAVSPAVLDVNKADFTDDTDKEIEP